MWQYTRYAHIRQSLYNFGWKILFYSEKNILCFDEQNMPQAFYSSCWAPEGS